MNRFRHLISAALCIILLVLPLSVDAADSSKLPQDIKVGIRFQDTAAPLVLLYSQSGLELGFYTGNQFNAIDSFIENDDIIVRKDSYFMNMNGSFIEYSFEEQRDGSNANIQGPIHIQVGGNFNTRQDAQTFLNSLSGKIANLYIVYENGWKVWQGLYTTTANAQNGIEILKNQVPQTDFSIIQQNSGRIQVLTKAGKVLSMYNPGSTEFHFRPVPDKGVADIVRLDGKTFRGSIIIKRLSGSDLTVINNLGLEEYLYGVVPREVSGSWPIEAQKAQAVAARNYTVNRINVHGQYGFDLCAGTHCQVYGGYSIEHPTSTKAVNDTKGKLITFNGKPIEAYYHSNSGGRTEDSENIWTNPIAYIRGIEDPFSIGAPNDSWTYTMSKKQVQDILVAAGLDVGGLLDMRVTEYSRNGRAIKLEINGTSGKKILEKDKIRAIFGYNNIKSTYFTINAGGGETYILADLSLPPQKVNIKNSYLMTGEGLKESSTLQTPYIFDGSEYKTAQSGISDDIMITGKGWGHGLGMSQYGAKKMAEEGYTYEQILTYYYTGVKVE
ncbi:SpoIID/LytB domain-containing protein [Geosporobacter ferrireducens]|uniref:Sporulation stage II protein D amidase enhancer LytB N-terminal domain-containing protein n=1 Tax=Geosporobacter ferrireducens TaxID=1424294 RepID=A0A1D8GPV0_9FIRM|nr:SpoIID/LytB domain-containing protein [Geosporobacter ferrireducens]AOT72814.1 hypothetical protein Gferi_26605 [Geosporobacter ferrireducens]MTI55213.1 SpoIID/LytB domain-containing protein [Geosporobacter ferrireducens]